MACNPLDTVAVFGSSHSAIIIIKTLIEQCNIKKIINFYKSPLRYAVFLDTGFKKRIIHIDGIENLQYNEHSGIIAPGLFGLGIAFPEKKIDRYGSTEYRVGLWKFMDFLNKVLPVWLKYGT